MFDGVAEQAMNLYTSLFPESEVYEAVRYKEGESEGKLQYASFCLNGNDFICIDTPVQHDFTFTPATSIFVDCESFEEIENLYSELSKNGSELMPLGNYGFSQKFGWINDRFGVSWQLNLP